MQVLLVPLRLRMAAIAIFLCVPLVAIEVAVVTRAPWWRLPYRNIGYWSLSFLLASLPIYFGLIRAKKWAFTLFKFLSFVWLLMSIWVSFRMAYPPLGFFSLFLGVFLGLEGLWLKLELGRSFFDPQIEWYHGLPKPIPGLNCHLGVGDKTVELKVSRMDRDGVFLFSPVTAASSAAVFESILERQGRKKDRKKLQLNFAFRNRQIVCQGVPVLSVSGGTGAGFQFFGVSDDSRKELGDFVEVLRGEGYV